MTVRPLLDSILDARDAARRRRARAVARARRRRFPADAIRAASRRKKNLFVLHLRSGRSTLDPPSLPSLLTRSSTHPRPHPSSRASRRHRRSSSRTARRTAARSSSRRTTGTANSRASRRRAETAAVNQLEHAYIRGSKIRFLVIPDMLKNAPMFKRIDPRAGGGGRGGRGGGGRGGGGERRARRPRAVIGRFDSIRFV